MGRLDTSGMNSHLDGHQTETSQRKQDTANVYLLADDHRDERRQQEEMRIRQNGTGKYTVRSVERESVANRQALFLGMVV